ncbi:MAG: minor capsid protein [Clostridiaceae bacterium]|nr:minor capsid protein [Clostridiaceae bacterium]
MPKVWSEPLPFDEAIDYFEDKVNMKSSDYRKLTNEYKTKAFTVSGYTSLTILDKFKGSLEKALKEGLTKDDFRKEMNDFLKKKGYDGLTPFQSDNIFRTNIQTAYNVGHYRRMTDPDVIGKRPYWMYDAVNDQKTRKTHLGMDGKVFPADHAFWNTWYPPNGFRCRCGVRTLSERQVEARGVKVEKEIPKMVIAEGGMPRPLLPDPGFNANPAKKAWEPDLKDFPKELRELFEERQKGK